MESKLEEHLNSEYYNTDFYKELQDLETEIKNLEIGLRGDAFRLNRFEKCKECNEKKHLRRVKRSNVLTKLEKVLTDFINKQHER